VIKITDLGAEPGLWVKWINQFGAAQAARKLLAEHRNLLATVALVQYDRPELTMETEMQQPRWTQIFTKEERAEAGRRLTRARQMPEWS
jgi:hypothetical protein